MALVMKHIAKGCKYNAVLVVQLTVYGGLSAVHHLQDGALQS